MRSQMSNAGRNVFNVKTGVCTSHWVSGVRYQKCGICKTGVCIRHWVSITTFPPPQILDRDDDEFGLEDDESDFNH